jgi:capsid portal protein
MKIVHIAELNAKQQKIVKGYWKQGRMVLIKRDKRFKAGIDIITLTAADEWGEQYAYPEYAQVITYGAS